jgi:hypothetical protein
VITIGVDPHKRVHFAQAVDEAGGDQLSWRGPNSPAGWAPPRSSALRHSGGSERVIAAGLYGYDDS